MSIKRPAGRQESALDSLCSRTDIGVREPIPAFRGNENTQAQKVRIHELTWETVNVRMVPDTTPPFYHTLASARVFSFSDLLKKNLM